VDVEKDTRQLKDWKKVVGEQPSRPQHGNVPGPSVPPAPNPPSDQEIEGESPSESEDEVLDSLEPSSDDEEEASVTRLYWEGGIAFQHFLISKAVSPTAEEYKSSPKEWTYRDILRLPKDHLEE
jgi:hypothetical protein